MTDDIADDEHQPIPEGHRIEPVAAGRGVLRGHQVLRRHVDTGKDGHRRGQQRLLHNGRGIPDVAVPLGQFLDARLGGQPCLHPVRHVVEDELDSLDRPVRAAARRHDEVEVSLLQSRTVGVNLQPPLCSGLWLTGFVHPVEHVVNLLALQLGKDFACGEPYSVERRIERTIGGVDRDEPVVGPLQAHYQRGDVLEDAPDVFGFAHGFVPVHFGRHLAVPS